MLTKRAKTMKIGDIYNRLTPISTQQFRSAHGKLIQWFQCECGSSPKQLIVSEVRQGVIKSCGCYNSERKRKPGAGFRILLEIYKSNAASRSISWELTDAQFLSLTSSRCYYTGRLPRSISKVRSKNGDVYYYNGIDRVDSTLGYTIDNCVPCCTDANLAKMSMSQETFLQLVQEIYLHRRGRNNGI